MMRIARLVAGLALAVLVVACMPIQGSPAESQGSAGRTITGSFLIQALPGDGFTDLGDGTCVGSGKYRDIAPGIPVRVTTDTRVDTDQSEGQVLGEGQLGDGVTPPDEFHPVGCKFLFEVTDLPDLDRYVLEVGHTGQTFLSSIALEEQNWHVDLTVNDCTASNPCNY